MEGAPGLQRAADGRFTVEQPERIGLEPAEAGLAQAVLELRIVLDQRRLVSGAAFAAADGIDFKRDAGNAQRAQDMRAEGDDFAVRSGLGRAEHLYAELVEFAQPPRPAAFHSGNRG